MALTRALASTATANLTVFVLSAGTSILLTRLLGPQGRGEFAIFTASAGLATLLLSCGLEFAISYFVAQGRLPPAAVPASTTLYAAVSSSLLFLLVIANDRSLGNEFFLASSRHSLIFEWMLACLVFGSIVSSGARAALLGSRQFHVINGIDVMVATGSLAAYGTVVILRRMGHASLATGGLMAVHAGLCLLAGLALLAVAVTRFGVCWPPQIVDGRTLTGMLRLGLKALLANTAQFLNYRFDYWVVGYFTDFRTLGLYSLASTLAQMVWLLPKSAATVFMPVLASRDRPEMQSQAAAARLTLAGSAVAGLVAALVSAQMIPLLFGSAFRPAALAFNVLLVGCVPYTLSIVLASGLAGRGLQGENTKASVWGLVATVVLDLLLIPRFGIVGAAAASSLSYLVTTLYVLRKYSRAFGIPLRNLVLVQASDGALVASALRRLLPVR